MKSKIIFSVILSAMLFTACNSETSLIDDIEPSGTTTTAPPIQAVQGETTSDENEGETNYILGGGTETTVSVTETAEETTYTETLPPKIENVSENVELDVHKIKISSILEDGDTFGVGGISFFGDIAAKKYHSGNVNEIRFFDINDLTVKAIVPEPDKWEFNGGYYPCIEGSGDVLCKIPLSYSDYEKLEKEYAVIVVYNDFTTKFIEGEPREILSFPAGNHNISDHFYDLFDIDSGEVIVEGFKDSETELGLASKWFDYKFPIDNERFVYRTCGFEWMPGFGYYDFAAGKAADFPDSRDFMPIGYHDGKIYAELTAWDGMCQGELRTFDTETLESKLFMPPNRTSGKFTEYAMSPNGSFIIANDFDGSGMNKLRIISPDSGENLVKCELNFGGSYGSHFTFIDNYRFAAEYGSELIIFDVKM